MLIGSQLQNFTGRIGFVGFGEPLLHPNIVECVTNVRTGCPTAQWIEINTNGDVLTRDLAVELAAAGCTNITISMYDKDNTDYFTEMLDGVNVQMILRHHYNTGTMGLINRINIIRKDGNILEVNRPCYRPFYKMFIDWNGDFLLCEQDWGKVTKRYNIYSTNIVDFWLDKLNRYRIELMEGNRVLSPCDKCDINGTKHGQDSFNIFYDQLTTK
jgi:MoaA/NifB/PqqE/SkfB family radical SAM enzyme